jgi:16S rRNA (adenine1518-N6/adenine1519-N6)-dimethyltransferase
VTLTRREARALLDRHGVAPSRALGQNFVVDPNTVRRIARLAGVGPGDPVVEVGAGLGSLTLALAETGAWVTAIELDRHLLPVLQEVVADAGAAGGSGGTVTVVQADAMTLDWPSLLGDHGGWSLVANLPYNVATPLVLDLLADVPSIERMLVMVQREAGERLVAPAGSRTYGIPSVKVAHAARARIVGHVPASVFLPRPRVDSVLVELIRHSRPPVAVDRAQLFSLVEQGFGQRRKMLRRSLAGVVDEEGFARAGVDPTSRPEDLDLEAWARLVPST